MADELLRRLERGAAAGDPDAQAQLEVARRRTGQGPLEDARRLTWLALVAADDPARRSWASGLVLAVLRSGVGDPLAVVAEVRARLRRLKRGEREDRVLHVLVHHLRETLDYVRWAAAWDALDPAHKQAVRAAGAHERRPPTPRQLDYLRALGDPGPPPRSLSEASARIAALQRGPR